MITRNLLPFISHPHCFGDCFPPLLATDLTAPLTDLYQLQKLCCPARCPCLAATDCKCLEKDSNDTASDSSESSTSSEGAGRIADFDAGLAPRGDLPILRTMGFVAVCTAIYDYQPQSDNELEIKEGELLYILEKGDDDWWKAKKRATGEEDEEPEGLIPNNYVEEAKVQSAARALYDYTRQTDEEISFTDDTALDVYDTSDPDWTLVGCNGEFGFAPANYIEIGEGAPQRAPSAASTVKAAASPTSYKPSVSPTPPSPSASRSGPAATLANVLGGGTPVSPTAARAVSGSYEPRQQFTPEASDGEEEAPALPQRPASQSASSPPRTQYAAIRDEEPPGVLPSPPYNRSVSRDLDDQAPIRSPGGFRMYHINEMVSAMGKRRKMPTTLGLNLATGIIMLAPEKTRDGPSQEWTAEKMTHYSIEGKHVFLELVRPSKSLDLHAGTSDTAKEIVGILGEIGGAVRGEGISEVLAAAAGGKGEKTGVVLYEFMAQGDDEVTVAVGDEVVILDDTTSEEWWQVRRVKKGTEGVVPSSYIEVTGFAPMEPPSRSGINAGRSTVEQNRLEEERLAKEASKRNRARSDSGSKKGNEVGPGMKLPQRGSSLADDHQPRSSKRDKRSSKADKGASRSKPDPRKIRLWTDRSGSFNVEAEFIGVADGKLHLHKTNGVKIAVPMTKMSPADLAYVERATNDDEDNMPLSMLQDKMRQKESSSSGAVVERPKAPDYDWFDFFLKAGVGPHQCERYAQTMVRDSMDESVQPDITAETLRTLGLKEGDILKVMKYLDQKFGRTRSAPDTNGDGGGLFSGPGGALKDNTGRRARPEANRLASDKVDADAFQSLDEKPEAKATPLANAPQREQDEVRNGFDDDAWNVKSTTPSVAAPQQPTRPRQISKPLPPAGALAELSILDTPLVPSVATPQPKPAPEPAPVQVQQTAQPQISPAPPVQQQQPQATGANPSFFSQLGQQQTGLTNGSQLNPPRQRPQAPISYTGSALLPPPPRPMSAPQNFQQQGQFGAVHLQPQLTGVPRTAALQAPPGQSLSELNQQQRLQQQYAQYGVQPQQTGFLLSQQTGFNPYQNGMVPQQTGFQPQQQFQGQPYLNGNAVGSPFADQYRAPPMPPQPGFLQPGPAPGSLNSVLPPALLPQRTAFQPSPQPQLPQQTNSYPQQQLQPQQTGFGQPPRPFQSQQPSFQPQQQQIQPQQTSFGQPPQQNGFGQGQLNNNFQQPPMPPMPQMPQMPAAAPLVAQKTGPAPPVRFGVQPTAKKLTPQPTGRANLANASKYNYPVPRVEKY
jgi:actin cytoskeleton-regulatory complex protein SLA1